MRNQPNLEVVQDKAGNEERDEEIQPSSAGEQVQAKLQHAQQGRRNGEGLLRELAGPAFSAVKLFAG